MPYDMVSCLWPRGDEAFFRDRSFSVVRQRGPHCVSTVLAILTGEAPEKFQGNVNTQDPAAWSEALCPWGMKLAYCPTDARKLKHYMAELVRLDDLFTLSYYTTLDRDKILGEPDDRGWVTGSHAVILHRGAILDSRSGTMCDALGHPCVEYHTKRVFRVVPTDHLWGLWVAE